MSRPRAATSVATSTSSDPSRKRPMHPVALLLGQPAVERAGVVAARAEGLGQLVDLAARPGEDERRRRVLDVEDAAQGARACPSARTT